jgi:hypothetical protein
LEQLTLHIPISNVILRAIHKNCPKLKELKIAHNSKNIFENIKFEQLESLSVQRMHVDFNLEFLLQHPKLRNFQLFNFPVSDSKMEYIVSSLPNLETLEIGNGKNLTLASLNPELTGDLKKIKIYQFNPKLKNCVSKMGNFKYDFGRKIDSESKIDLMDDMPRQKCRRS